MFLGTAAMNRVFLRHNTIPAPVGSSDCHSVTARAADGVLSGPRRVEATVDRAGPLRLPSAVYPDGSLPPFPFERRRGYGAEADQIEMLRLEEDGARGLAGYGALALGFNGLLFATAIALPASIFGAVALATAFVVGNATLARHFGRRQR